MAVGRSVALDETTPPLICKAGARPQALASVLGTIRLSLLSVQPPTAPLPVISPSADFDRSEERQDHPDD
jgi:hypothetical protein